MTSNDVTFFNCISAASVLPISVDAAVVVLVVHSVAKVVVVVINDVTSIVVGNDDCKYAVYVCVCAT